MLSLGDSMKIIPVELTDAQAEALAQFCKRSTWQDFRSNSASDAECQRMIDAVEQLRQALANTGYSPR
jgi:hypothetical protein